MTDLRAIIRARLNLPKVEIIYRGAILLALACLWIPFDGQPFILSPSAASLFGLVGGGYTDPGSDFSLAMRGARCLLDGVAVWAPQCHASPMVNLTPAALYLALPFEAFRMGLWLYWLLWVCLFLALVYLPFRRNARSVLVVIILVAMPGFLLGMRSGNLEVVIFLLVVLGCRFVYRSAHFSGAILLLLASLLKLFPIFAVVIFKRRPLWGLIVALPFAAYVYFYWEALSACLALTAYGFENTFGLAYHYGVINEIDPVWLQYAPQLANAKDLLNAIYRANLTPDQLRDLYRLFVAVSITPLMLVAFLVAHRRRLFQFTDEAELFALAGSLMVLAVFVGGWNWSYRYWVVFMLVPLLINYLEAPVVSFVRRAASLLVLVAIALGGISQYSVFRRERLFEAETLPTVFSIAHVVQYHSEHLVIFFAMVIVVSWLSRSSKETSPVA